VQAVQAQPQHGLQAVAAPGRIVELGEQGRAAEQQDHPALVLREAAYRPEETGNRWTAIFLVMSLMFLEARGHRT